MNTGNSKHNASGIYLHIPFCKQACHYCNFHFSTSLAYKSRMIDCLIAELVQKAEDWKDHTFHSIYLGGGTPSLLDAQEISSLFDTIFQHYDIANSPEITIEANPDDIDEEILERWYESGINRLSLGVQSLDAQVLQWMNRAHKVEDVKRSLDLFESSNITNISVDLIFGVPGTDLDYWKKELEQITSWNVDHISAYNLTVEEGTALQKFIDKRISKPLDEELARNQFIYAHNFLQGKGFAHYEISNYAKPGFESKHNRSYWTGRSYLGIGPSAHSLVDGCRSWNIAHNAKYMEGIENGLAPGDFELLTDIDRFNEWIMLGLRTSSGLHLDVLTEFAEQGITLDQNQLNPWIESGHILKENGVLKLSLMGMLLADDIAASLFN